MKKVFAVISCLISLPLNAATIDCHNMKLESVIVEGPRDDNHFFENKLIIKFDQECNGKSYVHADLTHPAFNGFLSIALAAKASEKLVSISVNSSNTTQLSNQIAYIALK